MELRENKWTTSCVHNVEEISDCKVVVGESVARQHRMVVGKMPLVAQRKKRTKAEQRTKWWKPKGCDGFQGGAERVSGWSGCCFQMTRQLQLMGSGRSGWRALVVSSGRKVDERNRWWNHNMQDYIQRKRLAKKKWHTEGTEESRQVYGVR